MRLSHIELFEDLAALYEEERIPSLKEDYADRYRNVVGIHPNQRQEFQAALERIIAGGRQSVTDVITLLDRNHQTKGSPLSDVS